MNDYRRVDEPQLFKRLYTELVPDGKPISLSQLVPRAARIYPERIALIYQDRMLTYQEFYAKVLQLVEVLKERGVQPRDRVLLLFENSFEFYISYFAIAHLGATVAPLNVFLHSHELKHIIGDAQPKLMIISDELYTKMDADAMNWPPLLRQEELYQYHEKIEQSDPYVLDPDEMAILLYTSGTTGLPKGVMLSSRNCIANSIGGIARLGLDNYERVIAALPLFHSFAQNTCVWGPLIMGCCVIIVRKIERSTLLEGIRHRPTIFLGVPALYGLLCLFKTVDLSSVKFFISGGDALPDKIRSAFALLYNRRICSGYGMTETSPVISALIDDIAVPTDTVGKPLQGVNVVVRNEHGATRPLYSIGEIWVNGDNVMLGYYNAPEKTKETIIEGWLTTGDLGYFDSEGRLVVTGRSKDLIINKGIKVYPQEIENVLLMHPEVLRAAVIGVAQANVGQVPIAYVQLRSENNACVTELKALCDNHLAPYKVPRTFICSPQPLPLTATGKVDKKQLRARNES